MIVGRLPSRKHSHRKGAVLVEFAIAVPILFLIFFTMIEFARFNMIRHGIDSAAYEGARRGIVPGATVADVQSAAMVILQAVSANNPTITVVPSVITPETTAITVTVDVPLSQNGWIVPQFISQSTITRSCTLAREQVNQFF